jgi:hypothetical protein
MSRTVKVVLGSEVYSKTQYGYSVTSTIDMFRTDGKKAICLPTNENRRMKQQYY